MGSNKNVLETMCALGDSLEEVGMAHEVHDLIGKVRGAGSGTAKSFI